MTYIYWESSCDERYYISRSAYSVEVCMTCASCLNRRVEQSRATLLKPETQPTDVLVCVTSLLCDCCLDVENAHSDLYLNPLRCNQNCWYE
jgi:hypothetical protein